MSKKILKIDASLLKDSSCSLRTFYTLIGEVQEPLVSIDIQFGSAFHHFAATMRQTDGNFALAIKGAKEILARPCLMKPKKEYLADKIYLQGVCYNWWDWAQESDNLELYKLDGQVLAEKNFAFKVYEDEFLIILLCGTIDMLGKVKNGCAAIADYKTTSFKDDKAYFIPYSLSVQLRTYYYAVQWHAKEYPSSIWADMIKQPFGCFIYGIFLEPPSSSKQTRFLRSDLIQFNQADMEEYEMLLRSKIKQIVSMYEAWRINTIKPYREGIINGTCEQKFGLCKYAPLCMATNETHQGHILRNNYVTRQYDPLLFSK